MSRFLFFAFLSLLIIGCASTARFNTERKKTNYSKKKVEQSFHQVRVLLDEFSKDISLSFNSKVQLKNDNKVLSTLEPNQNLKIVNRDGYISLKIDDKNYRVNELSIIPLNTADILNYDGKKYNGYFRVGCNNGKIFIVNVVNIEDYVESVVFSEFGTKFGEKEAEAVKAFSICVRNYSLLKLYGNSTGKYFDLYSDIRDQIYNGILKSSPSLHDAIQETRGKVLNYNDQLAVVFYHSSCGGYTEDCNNIFNTSPQPYLVAVKDGEIPNCSISPNFEWSDSFSGEEILNTLVLNNYLGKNFCYINSIEIKDRFITGRVKELSITAIDNDGNEKNLLVKGNSIRNLFKSKKTKGILRSLNFDITPKYDDGKLDQLLITGKGYGHGVGLCQWGAIAQARNGKKFSDILNFYFPGTNVEVMK